MRWWWKRMKEEEHLEEVAEKEISDIIKEWNKRKAPGSEEIIYTFLKYPPQQGFRRIAGIANAKLKLHHYSTG